MAGKQLSNGLNRANVEGVRRQQLIDATLKSIELYGFQGTTIVTISKQAGMSSGIISHYFGGKQGVIEAAVRYLLDQLKQGLLQQLQAGQARQVSPRERLMMIVETNFAGFQRSSSATVTWLAFWAKAMHDPALARLQRVNSQRLSSNLLYSFRQLIADPIAARDAAAMTAAMIDGMWLRSTLNLTPATDEAFNEAERLCKAFIDSLIATSGRTDEI